MKTPYDRAEAIKTFNRIEKTVTSKVRKLAHGAQSSDERSAIHTSLRKSVDSMGELVRFMVDTVYECDMLYARASGLNAALRFAVNENMVNYQNALYAESARLKKLVREQESEECGYLRELKLNALRDYGPR